MNIHRDDATLQFDLLLEFLYDSWGNRHRESGGNGNATFDVDGVFPLQEMQ